jgi:hypothetical protein
VVSCRLSAVTMPARIAWWLRLRFDNAAANPASPYLADNRLPDEILGQLRRIDWQAGPRQRPDILFNMTHAMQFSNLVFECEGARPLVLYDLIKARMSALMTSACVVIMPWGKPG